MFLCLEFVAFLLPAILFTLTRSEIVLYSVLLVYFIAHKLGANKLYKEFKKNVATF